MSTPPTLPPDPRFGVVVEMERLVGEGDWEGAARHFTPDVRYRVGARAPLTGVDGIRRHMDWQGRLVRWTGHDLHFATSRDEVLVIEVDSHFLRHADRREIVLPCTDVYRFDGMRIADWRVYADLTVFTAPDPAAARPPAPADAG